jgi:hypothetical protein
MESSDTIVAIILALRALGLDVILSLEFRDVDGMCVKRCLLPANMV